MYLRAHGAATGGQHRARPHRTLPVRLGAARWALELASARLGSGCASSAEPLRASYSTRARGHGGDRALGALVSMAGSASAPFTQWRRLGSGPLPLPGGATLPPVAKGQVAFLYDRAIMVEGRGPPPPHPPALRRRSPAASLLGRWALMGGRVVRSPHCALCRNCVGAAHALPHPSPPPRLRQHRQ